MRAVREKVLRDGRLIARGSEAKVYHIGKHAWKVYNKRFVKTRFQQNVRFLSRFSKTRVVPEFSGIACAESGLIRMAYLDEKKFVTLRTSLDGKQWSAEQRENVLELIWNARRKLPSSIQFCDFKNPANIMIQYSHTQQPVGAVFIEGGKETECPNAMYLFLEMIGDLLSVSKTGTFKRLRHS